MNTVEANSLITKIMNNSWFQKLKEVGGHKQYHTEGSAWDHTQLVLKEMKYQAPNDPLMWVVALVHDIGKIFNIEDNLGRPFDDWFYPHHSDRGAEALWKVIPKSHPDYEVIEWYIRNHIKTVHWANKGIPDPDEFAKETNMPSGASMSNLALLGACDLYGSYPESIKDRLQNQKDIETLLKLHKSWKQ